MQVAWNFSHYTNKSILYNYWKKVSKWVTAHIGLLFPR